MDDTRAKFADSAIDALGGTVAVARLLDVQDRVVSNWRQRGFPRDRLDALRPLLRKLRIEAPGVMFGQRMVFPKPPRRKNGKARSR